MRPNARKVSRAKYPLRRVQAVDLDSLRCWSNAAHHVLMIVVPIYYLDSARSRYIGGIFFSPNPILITYHSTQTSSSGFKTRHFDNIISELTSCLRIHAKHGSRLGGVSLEFTGELSEDGFSVTECLGGSMGLSEEQLGLRYQVSHNIKKVKKLISSLL